MNKTIEYKAYRLVIEESGNVSIYANTRSKQFIDKVNNMQEAIDIIDYMLKQDN